MNDLNQWHGIGRLGQDPETRYLADGTAVCNFSIACGWKTKEKEGAEWVRISAFGKLAEICGQYLRKGSRVYVGGSLQTRKWKDKNGQDRSTTEIRADKMQMLGSNGDDEPRKEPSKEPERGAFDDDSDLPF